MVEQHPPESIDQQPNEALPADDGTAAMPRSVDGALRFSFSFDVPSFPRLDSFQHWSHQALINVALALAIALIGLIWLYGRVFGSGGTAPLVVAREEPAVASPVAPNIAVPAFNPTVDAPAVHADAFVDPGASVVGNVTIERSVYIAHGVIIDSGAGQPMYIGSGTNIQAGTVISARPTFVRSTRDEAAYVAEEIGPWAVFVGREVTIATAVKLHGPVAIMDGAYVATGATVSAATIGAGSVVEPGAMVLGVDVPEGRYVPAGTIVATQSEAESLPGIATGYAFQNAGADTVAMYLAILEAMGFTGHVSDGDPVAPAADEADAEAAAAEDEPSGHD